MVPNKFQRHQKVSSGAEVSAGELFIAVLRLLAGAGHPSGPRGVGPCPLLGPSSLPGADGRTCPTSLKHAEDFHRKAGSPTPPPPLPKFPHNLSFSPSLLLAVTMALNPLPPPMQRSLRQAWKAAESRQEKRIKLEGDADQVIFRP